MLWVYLVSSQGRFGRFQTQDTFNIYGDESEQIKYADTGQYLFKSCDVPGEPKASYLCGDHGFMCHMQDKDAFPQSCVGKGWGASNKLGEGSVPNGKATLALYAFQTALSQGERIEVN